MLRRMEVRRRMFEMEGVKMREHGKRRKRKENRECRGKWKWMGWVKVRERKREEKDGKRKHEEGMLAGERWNGEADLTGKGEKRCK